MKLNRKHKALGCVWFCMVPGEQIFPNIDRLGDTSNHIEWNNPSPAPFWKSEFRLLAIPNTWTNTQVSNVGNWERDMDTRSSNEEISTNQQRGVLAQGHICILWRNERKMGSQLGEYRRWWVLGTKFPSPGSSQEVNLRKTVVVAAGSGHPLPFTLHCGSFCCSLPSSDAQGNGSQS